MPFRNTFGTSLNGCPSDGPSNAYEHGAFVNRECFAVSVYENGKLTCARCGAQVNSMRDVATPARDMEATCGDPSETKEAARALLRAERIKIVVSN